MMNLNRSSRLSRIATLATLLASATSLAIALSTRAQTSPERLDPCIEIVQESSLMTRPKLRQFSQVARGSARAEAIAVLGDPYCRLQPLEVELPDGSMATVQREAYPFEFAPHIWYVVMYAGDRYLTFDYSFPDSGRSN
ncbi:hypothetical protein H6F67_21840 [Microcoleus sp. FACHB-1515]|uniref:hypothetical protein n=1 Tax=Cyanophyceae TaxID=3028117 RepID=UPI001686F138|nr:hypothetical protein [Microcoleus sp. FACHB-1515]MBD2092494.1 hypothetical protein [Microcoleus sp. FACHB-1515]